MEGETAMYVEVKNASKMIDGNLVLNSINYSFDEGKIYGVIGKNGSGKTMLLKAICGLVRLSEGDVVVAGKRLEKGHDFPDDVGALIENPGIIGNYSGLKNLQVLADIKKKVSKNTISKLMESFNLDPKDKKKVKKYSLGMRQKIGIISAIMEDPKLILLDEPTNALDKKSVDVLNDMLKNARDNGSTIIIASHDFSEMEELADKLIEIEDGKIVQEKE